MSTFTSEELAALRAPFPLDWHIIREGYKVGGKMRWFVYIDRSAVQDLLDEIFPGEWETSKPDLYFTQSQYTDRDGVTHVIPMVSATVGITIRGITRWDGGDSEGDESTKGALTNAFRRAAAYGWGIGRYLYDGVLIETATWNKDEWQKRNTARDDAWKQFEAWYNKRYGMPRNPAPQAQQTAPATPKGKTPASAPQNTQSDDLGVIPYIAPGDKQWWTMFWQYVTPLYDNAKHAQNSVKKMTDAGTINAKTQTVAEAVKVVEQHVNLGADA